MYNRHGVEVAGSLRPEAACGSRRNGRAGRRSRSTATETNKRILALLDQPPPEGYARWTGPLLAAALGDVDVQYVWRLLRAQKIDLAGRKSWCESNDPEFVAKAADVVGLYMAPPENAIVICVDEKPSIQALERAQGYLKLPNGRALTGHSHDYKRNGTTTLFAAFEVATGKVTAAHKTRRRRIEFLDFMNDIVAAHADTAIHVVLDNLNTHKPRNDRWLRRHPNVHFHFTPTRASWLNQVEIWFSILQGKSLHGASFTSVKQLREHIDAFIKAYNINATPFAWTKSEVHQKRLKPSFRASMIPGTSTLFSRRVSRDWRIRIIPKAPRSSTFAEGDRKELEALCRSPRTMQQDLKRARIVLLAAEGRSTRSIAKEVGVQPRIVSRWRHRYADQGLDGLKDKPRPGKKPLYTPGRLTSGSWDFFGQACPKGFARWTGPLLAKELGDVDVQYVWRCLRGHYKIDLVARKSWCESNDPEFATKAADVVGLYANPPAKAIVLCVDEKPSIQALERARAI